MHFCQVFEDYKGVKFAEEHEKSWTWTSLAEVPEKAMPMVIQEAQLYRLAGWLTHTSGEAVLWRGRIGD